MSGTPTDYSTFPPPTANTAYNDPFGGIFAGNLGAYPSTRPDGPRGSIQNLPPGLPRHSAAGRGVPSEQLFGGAPPLALNEPPPMPGLGVLPPQISPPNAQIEPRQAVAPFKTHENLPSRPILSVGQKTNVVSIGTEDASFPALPKASLAKPVTETKKKGKDTSDARQNNEPKKREATAEKSTEPSRQNHSDAKFIAAANPRQLPAKLDTAAAAPAGSVTEFDRDNNSAAPAMSSKPATPIQSLRELSSTPSTGSRSATPNQAADTPLRRTAQPRTIRVLPTAKADTALPTSNSSTPSSQAPPRPSSVSSKRPSRQPSVTSINAPGTPTSEKIPDNASVTTDSVSRPNSPPPPIPNETAPSRTKTKSKAKKQRAEKAKQTFEEVKTPDKEVPAAEAPVHGPIIGRKKKSKKPATVATSSSTPELSRPVSPAGQTKHVETVEQTEQDKQPAPPAEAAPEEPEEIVQPPEEPASDPKPPKPSKPLPAMTLSQLESAGVIEPSRLDIFKANMGLFHSRHDITPSDLLNMQSPAPLTASELQALDAGEPIHRSGDDSRTSSRLLITPSRKCLPRLTAEMESRYLQLEKAIMESKPPFKYVHKRKEAAQLLMTADEILKDMCATLTRPPTTTAAASATASNAAAHAAAAAATAAAATSPSTPPSAAGDAASPNGAAYGDDALAYLNQFILPPLPSRGAASLGEAAAQPHSAGPYTAASDAASGLDAASLSTASSRYLAGSTDSASLGALNSLGQNLSSLAASGASAGAGADAPAGPAAITQALANAVNGVVQAAAAVTGVSVGSLSQSAATPASGASALGGFMSAEEAEQALSAARKEVETLEKKMAGLVRRNRRLAGLQ